jgi:Contractile injection system tube protein
MSQPDPNSITTATPEKATLKALPKGPSVTVHFNPASLVYTVENANPQQGRNPKRRQFAAQFTGKLTMDLQFDTTATGADVRKDTGKVAVFMESSAQANKKAQSSGANQPAPPVLSFDWGAYHFQGFMDSFKETIDFFSPNGIPLRALVSITLSRQDQVFDKGVDTKKPDPASLVPTAETASAQDVSDQGGDSNSTRALAAANGLENPRFTGGASLVVGGGIQLNGPVGFVASASVSGGIGFSGGVGIGISGAAGIGISGVAGASASAGLSLGVGVSVSTGAGGQVTLAPGGGALFGSSASAGVPASAGAFAGLEVGRATISTTAQLDPLSMIPATVGSNVSTGALASFDLGGAAASPTGFAADVGANFSFSDRLTFSND